MKRQIIKFLQQKDFEKLFPVTDSTYERWENGYKVSDRVDRICRIVEAFQADIDYANNCNHLSEIQALLYRVKKAYEAYNLPWAKPIMRYCDKVNKEIEDFERGM